jgi:hypothetical protein
MLSFIISYPDLIKLPYFADLTQRGDRGWKQAQRQGENKAYFEENSIVCRVILALGIQMFQNFILMFFCYILELVVKHLVLVVLRKLSKILEFFFKEPFKYNLQIWIK